MHVVVKDKEQWLKSTYNLAIPSWWIEKQIQTLPKSTNMNSQIFKSFLHTDINDFKVGVSCLPKQILASSKQSTSASCISGRYCVQINGIVDIGVAAYSQLRTLKGLDDTNIQITESFYNTNTTQASKPSNKSSNRMCELSLSDGSGQLILAIEYQHIPQINLALPPGTKIVLHNKIKCRRGLLMLTRDNVEVLGGEVQALGGSHGQLALLANKLRLNEADAENSGGEAMDHRGVENEFDNDLFEDGLCDDEMISLMNDIEGRSESERPGPTQVPSLAPDRRGPPQQATRHTSSFTTSPSNSKDQDSDNRELSNYSGSDVVPQGSLHEYEEEEVDEDFMAEQMEAYNRVTASSRTNNTNRSTPARARENIDALSKPKINSKPTTFVPPFRCETTALDNKVEERVSKRMRSEQSTDCPEAGMFPGHTPSNPPCPPGQVSFSDLKQLVSSSSPKVTLCQVKGFVLTLLERLSVRKRSDRPDKRVWYLKARLTADGKIWCDVSLSNDFLISILNITVDDMRRVKQQGTDRQKTDMMKAMSKCQEKIIKLCGLFDLKVSNSEISVTNYIVYKLPQDRDLYENFVAIRKKQNISFG